MAASHQRPPCLFCVLVIGPSAARAIFWMSWMPPILLFRFLAPALAADAVDGAGDPLRFGRGRGWPVSFSFGASDPAAGLSSWRPFTPAQTRRNPSGQSFAKANLSVSVSMTMGTRGFAANPSTPLSFSR